MQAAYAVSPMYAGARLRKLLHNMVPEDTDQSLAVKTVLNQIYIDHGRDPLFKTAGEVAPSTVAEPVQTIVESGYDEF
jgi:hypothetical protein